MKTFMKFTLAVFCMLLAGAAADTFQPKYNRLNGYHGDNVDKTRLKFWEFNQGCRAAMAGGDFTGEYIEDLTKSPSKREAYRVRLWASGLGLDTLLNSGCVLCAPKFGRQKACDDWKKEFNYYIRFKVGQWTGEHGRITQNNPFCAYNCNGGVVCKHMADDLKGPCKNNYEDQQPTTNARPNVIWRKNFGVNYGDAMLTVNGWGVPTQWKGLRYGPPTNRKTFMDGAATFAALDKYVKCYTRGCSTTGFVSPTPQSIARGAVSTDSGLSPADAEEEEKIEWEKTWGKLARKTIDAEGPSPVNQSKGFDGYQTALIVGLSVLSSFITAGSIYACRRLNEKAIELPADVEDKIVIA